jgi:hypothetical protein
MSMELYRLVYRDTRGMELAWGHHHLDTQVALIDACIMQ